MTGGVLRTFFWLTAIGLGTCLFRRTRQRAAAGRQHFLVTMGGGEFRPAGDQATEAVVSVLMGGAVVDLRNAATGAGPRRLDVVTVMGGTQIIVPEDWSVRMEVQPIPGGVRDARTTASGGQGQADLVIFGRVVCGGVEVRSRTPQEERAQKAPALTGP